MTRGRARTTWLVCLAGVVLGGAVARADAPPGAGTGTGVRAALARRMLPHCLTPDVGRTLADLRDTGRVAAVLPDGWALTGGEIGSNAVALAIRDRDGHAYGLSLALPGTRSERPDGHGRTFTFHLSGTPLPAGREALLRLATLIDTTIPATAMQPCPGRNEAARADHAARWRTLTSAAVQMAAVVAAIVFGLAALPRDVD